MVVNRYSNNSERNNYRSFETTRTPSATSLNAPSRSTQNRTDVENNSKSRRR
jgi:hypothetical protein